MGIPADERSVASGGSPEPGESDGDPENLNEPDDEELDEMVSDDESDTISVFTDIPEEISPDSDHAQKLLEDEIIRGSGFSNGKFRISEYVSENSPNKDELAKFLKNEYGIGGSSRNDDPVSFSNHDGKGIELVLSNRQVIRFNWKKVAEAVRSAVNSGKYITESDIEMRRRMTLFDAQRFAIHYEYPHCLYNDRLDYIRKEIAACGLDLPIRLNADMFAVYAAECVRTKPHIKESYQKIDRSSIDIPWKFNDWNEAAEAGKNLPVDSGYGQFRAMCRDSVSELMNEISAHTGHNPALGFPEEEITEFFASGEPLTSDSVDKITSEVFGYLYNQEQHSRLSYNNPTEIIALDQPAEQFTLFGDNEFTMEEPQADESLNRATAYIKDYFEQEFGSAAEIEDPSHIDLAYTTDEENDAVISVYADLVQYRITTEYGGNIAREEQYNSLDEMNELALKYLSFDDLTSLSDEEKGFEVRHGVAVEENESEVRHDVAPKIETADRAYAAQKPTPPENYRFPENFAYPTGPKAKYTANVTAIKTLKQIESEHRHATAEEQDILAHYSGWGGIADAFDSTKENWSRKYAELKDLLTDKEYAAARESTLTAFYTEPYIIKSVYTALENIGFTGGEILDPAMGTGNFFGNLPAEMAENSRLYGVELDSLTARIAKELYPEAKIQNRGFERTKFENGTFDVIVGNVPFGDFKPYDPEYDEYLIHDYFFAKSIDKLKPGGIMALITSAGTMDKYDDSFRRELAGKADFLGGVRLPEDAFRTAGTQTVTDILFFQKLEFEHENDRNLDWVRSERVYGEASVFQENRYFRQNPEMVLGTPEIVSGRFGNTRTIKSDGNTAKRLSEAIGRLDGHFSAEPTIDDELPKEEYGDIPDGVTPYTYYVSGGSLYYAENRSAVPFTGSSEPRIKAMCGILDRLNEVTAAQKKGCSDDELKALQRRLNNAYDGFIKKYGHLNGRTNISAFADDIRAPRLTSIENVEELPDGKQRFTKADIFTQRTINVDRVPAHVDTALEALHLSINLKQTVDLEYISQLCGKDKDAVISELGEHIYCNPAKNTGGRYSGWETAEEYLSGHVRTKLALAQEAAKTDPDYERNAAALLDNQPPRIGIEDIGFRVGTIYIEPEMFQDFVYETFQTPEWQRHRPNMHGYSKEITVNYSPEINQWKVTNSSGMLDVLSTETYGTKRLNAYELTELLLNQKRAVVNDYRELPDGRTERVFNAKETILARECQDKIEQAFHDWVMADKDRIQIIEDRFNALFNNIKPRTYNGDYITIPGMNPNLSLRPHQKNVIARIAATGTCMMAHEVGAGKTAAMGAAGMYLKSIGACTKPMYVVPNAVVAQFGEELQRFFPEAKILVATSKDMEKSQRRRFLSKISVGNFDAIVIPQSQFEKMPLSLERQEAMYDEKLTEISSAIQAAKADKGERFTVKALERQRKQIEKKIEKMRAAFKKDDFITFEELGCDFLFVDEAHNYKNLAVFSKMNNVAGVNANANSQKAFDMEMKCRYLQELHNGGGVVFATGTPISNSITELFVWQYLLQKQTLDDMNIGYFDNWASVFGVITQSIEVKPSGDGFRPRTRFSNFVNLNELCNLFGEVFDIAKTADMNLKLPAIQNGKPEMIICEKSPEQELQTDAGIERARRIEAKMVQPDEDNMLAVCTYMTKVALDARIIDPEAEEYDGGKVALCAEKIIEINKANPGTAQAVFCDTNTPKKDAFSVYQALRDRLVRSGEFTENEIAFVHDTANDKQRLAMFEKVNNAEIKIIIGSTGKLGTGVNIQRKLSALHHLDAPYRPSDIEQRNGRGIRQGNENSEVYIGYYSTKGTFDNYRWQILEKKQQIISQIMSGKPAARTCEDIDDTALTFAEMKAATTGNPLIAEKMTVDNEVNRLKLLQANYYQQQRSFEYDISNRYPDLISRKEKMIEWTKKDIELISAAPPITEDNFRMTLVGRTYVERTKAGDELSALVTKYMMSDDYQEYKPREIGKLNDFKIMLLHKGALVSLSLKANGHYTCDYSMSGLGGVTRLCNLYERIPEQIHGLTAELEQAKKQLANAKEQYGKPFQYEEQLRAGLERQAQINAELEVADKPHDEAVMSDYSDGENEEMEM
ncbi:MAG: helicase-related protein [Oscillospiraceae bacterium]